MLIPPGLPCGGPADVEDGLGPGVREGDDRLLEVPPVPDRHLVLRECRQSVRTGQVRSGYNSHQSPVAPNSGTVINPKNWPIRALLTWIRTREKAF